VVSQLDNHPPHSPTFLHGKPHTINSRGSPASGADVQARKAPDP
jgi:hypothetical protein